MPVSLGSLFATLGLDASGFDAGIDRAQKSLDKASQKMKKVGKTMTTYITLPLVAAGTASIKLASDFETSMTKIETLVGIASDRVNQMKADVIALSNETGRSSRELADALFVVTSAGQRGAEAMEILESSAKASAIGLGETNEIARATTAVLNAYGKENISAAKATDQLLAIVREGNLEASELAPTLGRVIGIASQVGVSFAEVGASIATFTRLGVSSEEAVTGLRGILNTLISPTEQGREALSKLGLTFAEVRSQVREKGLAQTLIDLIKRFKGNTEGLSALIPNVRALSAALGTAGAQGKTYAQIANTIANANGLVDQGFQRVSQTSAFQFKQALEELKNVGIELGNLLLPVAIKIVNAIRGVVQWFRGLSAESKKLVVVIGGLAAGLGPIITILGTIGTVLAGISLPIVGVIAAIGGLAAAFVYLSENWEAVKERISDWSWWQNMLVEMAQFLIDTNPFSLIIDGVNEIASFFGKEDLIPNPFEAMAEGLEGLKVETKDYEHEFGTFTDAVLSKANKIKQALLGLSNIAGVGGGTGGGGGAVIPQQDQVTTPKSGPGITLEGVNQGLVRTLDAISERAKTIPQDFSKIKASASELGQALQTQLISSFNAVGETIGNLFTGDAGAGGFFGNILSAIADFMKQFGQAIIAMGVAKLALDAQLFANPVGAIAAGIALVAAGTALKNLVKKGPQPAKMQFGGVVPPGFPNDSYPALLSSGERVIPDPAPLGSMGGKLTHSFDMRKFIIEFDQEKKRMSR